MECQPSNYSFITAGSLAIEFNGVSVSGRASIKEEEGLLFSSSAAEWVELRDKAFLLFLASNDTKH